MIKVQRLEIETKYKTLEYNISTKIQNLIANFDKNKFGKLDFYVYICNMKICNKCKIEKDLNEFFNHKQHKDGKTSQCKTCIEAYNKTVREQSKLNQRKYRAENREKHNETKRKWFHNQDPRKKIFYSCKARAKRTGIEFTITLEDIVVPELCPILNIPFQQGSKNNYKYSYSLDRIDNNKGYIPGNVKVISMLANTMKSSATLQELLDFCKNLPNYLEQLNYDIVRTANITEIAESGDKEPQS